MASTKVGVPTWKAQRRKTGDEWKGALVAYWSVEQDTISDDYSPHEIAARDLLQLWAEKVGPKHPEGLIPIVWSVQPSYIRMPFQFEHLPEYAPHEDFLSKFTWPENSLTGEPVNWLNLPVADKLLEHGSKGWFIQLATGWKPSILQPLVYLPSLMSAVEAG